MQHVARRSSMVAILEHGSQPGDSRPNRGAPSLLQDTVKASAHRLTCYTALFGVPLKTLIKHEATDSHHGLHPATTLRIPTFLDHCITALMQMGAL